MEAQVPAIVHCPSKDPKSKLVFLGQVVWCISQRREGQNGKGSERCLCVEGRGFR